MPNAGDVVAGKFVLEKLIGQGGMGAVFAARHRELDSVVAVKVMLTDTSNVEATTRFKNEGRAAAKIRSEHVVRVEDVGEENGYAYMILELLDGEDLSQVLERVRRVAPADVVACMLEACEGVRRAHDKGIIHRDLKPSNLFVSRREDGSKVVKVLDFGISKSQSTLAQAPGSLTSTKAMLGSPLYMSPEQLRSSKSVDVRADIWALGVIMYELLSGTCPYMGESLGELFAAILETDPTPLRVRAPDVPPELEAVVMRCLQRRPENRFQNVMEVIQALVPVAQAYANGMYGFVDPGAAVLGPLNTKLLGSLASVTGSSPAIDRPPYPSNAGVSANASGGYRAMAPSIPGTTTGSGAYIPVVKGTAPLGAVTPQPYAQSGSMSQSWPNAAPPPAPAPKNAAKFAAIGGAALVLVLGVAGFALTRNREVSASVDASGEPTTVVAKEATTPPLPETNLLPTAEPKATPSAQADPTPPAPTTEPAVAANADEPGKPATDAASKSGKTGATGETTKSTASSSKPPKSEPTASSKSSKTSAEPTKPTKPTKPSGPIGIETSR